MSHPHLHESLDDPVCATCGEAVDPSEDWCFGCRHFVCADCSGDSEFLLPAGQHNLDDHQAVR